MQEHRKQIFMVNFVFNAVVLFGMPAAFILGQNFPNDGVVTIYPYVILQLILAMLASGAFWFLFLRKR